MFEEMFQELRLPLSLGSDNHSGVHPRFLAAIAAANRGHAHAYGLDEVSKLAEKEFKRAFGNNVEVHYVFNGTAANVLSLMPLVRSFEAVICSEFAHLHDSECGAPEKLIGCQLYVAPTKTGKITPEQAEVFITRLGDQHFSQPKLVSLTQPTETGTCYSLTELRAWKSWCLSKNLMLHLDGARLCNAAAQLNVSLKEMTADVGVDVVSFGGTKNGMLAGEAVLLFNDQAKEKFKFYRKQAMQLPSKTRFLAAQFYAYLKNDFWRELAQQVIREAAYLSDRLKEFPEIGLPFPIESNAVFVQLPKAWINPLREKFFFYVWDPEQNLCRWMITFDWGREQTDQLIEAIRGLKRKA